MHGELFWPGAANWKIKTGNACKTLRPFYGVWAVSNAGAFFFLYAHWSWAHWCIIALLKLQLINHFNYPRSARVHVPEEMRQPWSYLHKSWIPLETITIVIGLLWAVPGHHRCSVQLKVQTHLLSARLSSPSTNGKQLDEQRCLLHFDKATKQMWWRIYLLAPCPVISILVSC